MLHRHSNWLAPAGRATCVELNRGSDSALTAAGSPTRCKTARPTANRCPAGADMADRADMADMAENGIPDIPCTALASRCERPGVVMHTIYSPAATAPLHAAPGPAPGGDTGAPPTPPAEPSAGPMCVLVFHRQPCKPHPPSPPPHVLRQARRDRR